MRGKRHLKKREPMINENPKQIYYLHGTKCPQLVQNIFKDWVSSTAVFDGHGNQEASHVSMPRGSFRHSHAHCLL